MKFKTHKELEKMVKDDILVMPDDDRDIICKFDINLPLVTINAENIDAENINAVDINAGNINAVDINARYINAGNIDAFHRSAIVTVLVCLQIFYGALVAGLKAGFAYNSIKCKSIKGRRKNSKHFCLDKDIELTQQPKE